MRVRVGPLVFCLLSACSPALQQRGSEPPSLEPAVVVALGADTAGATELIVAREVVDGWNFLYANIDETEFALCLEGTKLDGKISITSFKLAHIVSSSETEVRYMRCASPAYIGSAHNHPPRGDAETLCYQSSPDKQTFLAEKRAMLDIVICGKGTFMWVLKNGRHGVQR